MSTQPPYPPPAPQPTGHGPGSPQAQPPQRKVSGPMWASIIVTVLLLIGGVILVIVLLSGNDDAADRENGSDAAQTSEEPATPDGETTEPTKPEETTTSSEPGSSITAPATARDDFGIPLGQDGAAGTVTEDAVEVAVYLDYMCPICGTFEELNAGMLDDLRADGTITLVLHPISILDRLSDGSEYSTRSAAAAAWVADRAPEGFADFNAALFEKQPEEGTTGLTNAQIEAVAVDAGVPEDVAAGIGDGSAVSTFRDWVTAATDHATGTAGVRGTPTVMLDGQIWDGNWTTDGELEAAIRAAS
ncbi:MAG: DsbA family protein [Cellulomonadaceae bacterium]